MILRNRNRKIYAGASLIALLFALSLFSLLVLGFSQWHRQQERQANQLFLHQQAWQIALNQKNRLLAGLACENQVQQNGLDFQIQCSAPQVIVRYLGGEIRL